MILAALVEKVLFNADDCPGPAIGICWARSEGPVQAHWGSPAGTHCDGAGWALLELGHLLN